MDTLQTLASQLHFSLSMSEVIVSLGIMALGLVWGRIKLGLAFSLGSVAYWEYATNKAVLFEMMIANAYGIFVTTVFGLILGFLLFYAWVLPSSNR